MKYFIFLITVPNLNEGKKLARILVEDKIAACVNIIPDIISIYRWKGSIEEETECILIAKTVEKNNELLIKEVKENHSYTEPECIGLKIEDGSETYLKWLSEAVL